MATPQSSLILKQWDGFGGNFIDAQYLGHSYDAHKPYVFENTLQKIYSSRSRFFTDGKVLSQLINANTVEIDAPVFRWSLQGAEHKSARVIEVIEASTTPGLNGTTFRVKLDLNYFAAPDVLMSEDNEYPLEIVNGPIADGAGFIYELRIQTDSPTVFLPTAEIQLGRRYDKVWTTVAEEMNDIYGTQQAPSSFMLESQLGFFGQKLTVTDKAMRVDGRLSVDFIMSDGKGGESRVTKFLPMAEAVMQNTLYASIEHQLLLGKKSTRLATNGYVKRTGPGVREQLKDGWTQYYSGLLTATLLETYLMDIFFSREDVGSRKVVGMTGEIGQLVFHKALANLASGFLTLDTKWIQDGPNVGGTPGLSFGRQYSRYYAPNGIVVELMLNPLYDSEVVCKKQHPLYAGRPIDSGRITFMDFGTGNGNVMMVKEKNSFTYGYVPGMVGPNGPITSGPTSSLLQGYETAIQTSAGIVIKDTSRGGELIVDTTN